MIEQAKASRGSMRSEILGALVIVVLWSASFALRIENIFDRPLMSHAEDATGHVWATLKSMSSAPAQVHKYLPIVTLSQSVGDKGVDSFLGASITDGKGDYFYVSFPPAGFAAPELMFQALGAPPTVIGLRLLSAAIGLVSALLLYLLALELARNGPASQDRAVAGAVIVAALFALNSEALWIFGNIYWHHVLLEPFLLLTLLGVARHLRAPSTISALVVGAALFLSCLIEWTAFAMAGGVIFLGIWLLMKRRRGGAPLVAAGITAAAAAGAAIFMHFAQVAGIDAYLAVLEARPEQHAIGSIALIQSLYALAGLYGPLAALAAFVLWGSRRAILSAGAGLERSAAVLFVAAAACAEGVLLLHHTTWYTYASLPLTTFVLLLLFVLFLPSIRTTRAFGLAATACCAAYLALYFVQNPPHLASSPFGRQFDGLDVIATEARPDEAVFANIDWPLGTALGRAHRNIIASPRISINATPEQMITYLRDVSPATQGKLFLYDVDHSRRSQWVWWPYTKSRVVYRPAARYGPLVAIITFDENGVKEVRSAKGVRSAALNAWLQTAGTCSRPSTALCLGIRNSLRQVAAPDPSAPAG